ACYAHYAGHAFSADPAKVVTRLFELLTGAVHEQSFTKKSFDELFSYIRGSVEDMRGLLDDVGSNRASENRFVKVETAGVCLRCNFLKVCKPSI
ncbi:MAG: hypothetical protein HY801_15840, partial [Candidatus Lindowbacteria bacterium]|nr:hypothetical protein [Candidatus Lindowbacteria bacterium]